MKKETLTVETDENGTVTYRNADDQLHNPNGPAVVWADGSKYHYINGELHNANGPAVVHSNGDKEYCINDRLLTEAEFKAWQSKRSAPLHNTTKVIDGVEYTLTAK